MFDRFRNHGRRNGRALRAFFLALLASITGCDKKVAWKGVSTDSRDAGRSANPDATRGESSRWQIADDPRPRGRTVLPWLVASLFILATLGLVVALAILLLRRWDFGIGDTRPTLTSTGPTMVQLERLQYLVSTRVHVADVLVGESRWLQGSWIIQGDALIGVDMSRAEIKGRDEKARTAVIVLPQPAVISPRVNHERSQQWDIKSRSWIPMASMFLGDRQAMEKQAMLEAQRLVERVAGSEEYKATARHRARRDARGVLSGRRLARLGPVEVTAPHDSIVPDPQIRAVRKQAPGDRRSQQICRGGNPSGLSPLIVHQPGSGHRLRRFLAVRVSSLQ